ncbi:hypothetical protein BT96DRAFT_228772 [Gymnopus androsaceus JB14]|uniref:Uncharacterized protein n=1 Tax=Gymnopus androsaceus JB14 TaxID=1447944 RepID=A0A6A4H4W0_9AGAR|nr:hypothetical protein BT96DRAFT_228772 [Gymnopus androsaceus JB14]
MMHLSFVNSEPICIAVLRLPRLTKARLMICESTSGFQHCVGIRRPWITRARSLFATPRKLREVFTGSSHSYCHLAFSVLFSCRSVATLSLLGKPPFFIYAVGARPRSPRYIVQMYWAVPGACSFLPPWELEERTSMTVPPSEPVDSTSWICVHVLSAGV